MLSLIFLSILLVTTDMVQGKYIYLPQIEGWINVHRQVATWDEAYAKCRSEGYAILASPITSELRDAMTDLFSDNNTSYFIGTSAMFYPGSNFRSIEGISIDDMNVTYMYGILDSQLGQCLSMNEDTIRPVSCTARLPFVCYKKQLESMIEDECGTYGLGYKLSAVTGSCYKLHANKVTWDEAYVKCEQEGGYLVVINSEEEAREIFNITGVESNFLKATKGEWFISVGMRDRNADGDWMSIHGHRVQDIYNKWLGESETERPNENCGKIYYQRSLLMATCHGTRPFICEKDPKNTYFSQDN